MEYIIFILLIVLLVVVTTSNSGLREKIVIVNKKLDLALSKLNELSEELKHLKTLETKASEMPITSQPAPIVQIRPEPLVVAPLVEPETIKEEPVIAPLKEEKAVEIPVQNYQSVQPHVVKEPVAFVPPRREKAPPKPSFFERNPDLEKFIGENLINKIGIAILVIGIGFFVKYAIDQDWINEIGRVAIGILCGGILLGIAHKLRNTFKPFSSVLVGGGLAVFYFTITIAFQQYHIFPKEVAFGLMVIITGFAIVLSIAYNRVELAVLAIVGGFSSPFFVSDGSGNYVVMFVYVLILNTGMLILAYFKRWNLVNIVSYGFTIVLYGGWLTTKVINQPNAPYLGALLFATAFFVIFFLMNIINNVKENRKFVASEISILLSNNALYYSAGMTILHYWGSGKYQGLFTALVAVFNFVFAYVLYTTKKADKNVVYLLIGLVLTFASLTAPVQLEGNHITLFWALEAVLLLWLSQKSGIQMIKLSSIIVNALMIISLIMDWRNEYFYLSNQDFAFFLNKAFVTSIVSLFSLVATFKLLDKEGAELFPSVETSFYRNGVGVVFVILLYFTFMFEFTHQIKRRLDFSDVRALYLASYNLLFACGLLFALRKKERWSIAFSVIITAVLVVTYLSYYNICAADVRNLVLTQSVWAFHYYYHYVLTALMLGLVILLFKRLVEAFPLSSSESKFYLWPYAAFLVYITSAELEHFIVYLLYQSGDDLEIERLKHQVFRIGYPILWGVCSFIVMYLGLRKKVKTLRIVSLVMFGITLLKLFIFDVSKMNEGGKIAAFILLGVLLLVISFMYQKLKKLIIEDEGK